MARTPYDAANEILNRRVPAIGSGNAILGKRLPFMDAGNRVVSRAGLIPKGGGYDGTGPANVGPGRRGALPPGTRTGPLYTGPRTPLGPGRVAPDSELADKLGALVKDDQVSGAVVQIQRWAELMQANGIDYDGTIFPAYNDAGGSADLSAEQRAGDTSDFLADFTRALVNRGADPEDVLDAYQDAGGRIGANPGGSGGGGRSGGVFGGGTLGDAAGAVSDVADAITREVGKLFR